MAEPARWPRPDEDDRDVAVELYKVAVEEYRWQATYNWQRTQYLLTFNAGVLTAGALVATRPSAAAALLFALGAVAAWWTREVVQTQHDYYRAARDRMRRLEADLGVDARHLVDSTSTLGGRPRKHSVNDLVGLLLKGLVAAHAAGVVLTIGDAVRRLG